MRGIYAMAHTLDDVKEFLKKVENIEGKNSVIPESASKTMMSLTELGAEALPVEKFVVMADRPITQVKNELIRLLRNNAYKNLVHFSGQLSLIVLNDQNNGLSTTIFPASEIYTTIIPTEPVFELTDQEVFPFWESDEDSISETEEPLEEYIDKKEKSETKLQESVEIHLEEIHQENEESKDENDDELNENEEKDDEDNIEAEEEIDDEDDSEADEEIDIEEDNDDDEDLSDDETEEDDDEDDFDDEDDLEDDAEEIEEDDNEEESDSSEDEDNSEAFDDEVEICEVLEENIESDDDEDLDVAIDESLEDDEEVIANQTSTLDLETTKDTNKKIEQIKISNNKDVCFFKLKEASVTVRPDVHAVLGSHL